MTPAAATGASSAAEPEPRHLDPHVFGHAVDANPVDVLPYAELRAIQVEVPPPQGEVLGRPEPAEQPDEHWHLVRPPAEHLDQPLGLVGGQGLRLAARDARSVHTVDRVHGEQPPLHRPVHRGVKARWTWSRERDERGEGTFVFRQGASVDRPHDS